MFAYIKSLIWKSEDPPTVCDSDFEIIETENRNEPVEPALTSIETSPIRTLRVCIECKNKYPETLFQVRKRKKTLYYSKQCDKCYRKLFSWNR